MALLKLLAKVKLYSESEMEQNEGVIPDEAGKWKKKMYAIHSNDIYRLVKYDSSRTILTDMDGNTIMVYEPFDQVFDKWEKALEEDYEENEKEVEEVQEEEPNPEEDNDEE